MADIRATQSGAFEATSTWVGGVVPGSGDVAFANTFTVTISDARTVQAVSNASGTSITVGGTFSLLNGANLTCTNANGVVQGATATPCITTPSLGVGSSASVAANSSGSGSNTTANVNLSTAGTLNWTGNVVGSSAATSSSAILVSGTGTLAFTGNSTGGTQSSCVGITLSGAGTITIGGNVTGGSSATSYGLNITGTGSVSVNSGSVNGGTTGAGINNASTGTLTVTVPCQSSSAAPAIAAGGVGQVTRLSGPFLLGASGNINPIQCQSWRWAPTLIPTYMEVARSDGSTKRNLFSADNMPSGGYPVAANVRQSTVYGPSSEFTGTLSVPSASSVALGVATDNTTGTAILTAAAVASSVWSAATRTLTGSSGSAPTAAEVATAVRTELTTELGRIDAATSTRLAAASYTAPTTPPTAAAVASQVRTELTTELARLDVATSTRLAAASYSAAPTTAAIRTELSTELARIDVAVSTRLAPSGTLATVTTLTNAPSVPSAATIASQVRTELTPELARVANCSTVDTTATAIQDAVSG
jgi:hypothetical protein